MKINPTKTIAELLTTLTYIIDNENGKKNYHSWRVAILSAHLAKNKVKAMELKNIFYAGLLHDIGAAGLSRHIIHYLKQRDKASRNILLSHPIISAQLVSNIPRMTKVAKLILDHHEWINGEGYPRAKTEKDIPPGAQIIRLADAIDICLQAAGRLRLKDLKNKLTVNINKEYRKNLLERALNTLSAKKLLSRISSPDDITSLFNEIKEEVGLIHIPSKIDAIGTALEVVSQIIDMRHPYNAGHSLRVSRYALAIALAMNLTHDEITRIKWAGLIHDIGKFNISRFIMNKPGRLSGPEFLKIKKHAQITQDMMAMIPALKEIVPIAVNHHEYYDGSGYPRGLKADEVPLGARILVVCDAFDAMTSNRPYRNPLSPQATCEKIQKLSGKQFDPGIVNVALPLFLHVGL